jgi:hypothetical protein
MSQTQQVEKPKIRVFRDKNMLWWSCNGANKFGYGRSPMIAYKNWARQMPRVERME